jgi:hypothetical protein
VALTTVRLPSTESWCPPINSSLRQAEVPAFFPKVTHLLVAMRGTFRRARLRRRRTSPTTCPGEAETSFSELKAKLPSLIVSAPESESGVLFD